MNNVFLLTGGNMGDRRKNLGLACNSIEQKVGRIVSISKIYETEAWGNQDQQSFLNQVLLLQSKFSAFEILQMVLDIEKSMGRERIIKFGPRLIDIDILFYNSDVISTPTLTIPHPEIPNRRFVLTPLAEIAPHFIHPILHQTMLDLLLDCKDSLKVTLLD